jgi:MSHA biogenesis protein MshJ
MNEMLAQWQAKLDGMNTRERLLVMLSILAVIGFLLNFIAVEPFAKDRQRLKLQATDIGLKLHDALAQQQALQALLSGAQQSPLMKRKQQLEQSIQQREQELNESVNMLISPDAMAKVLEGVLSKQNGLQLVRLENLPVKPLITAGAEPATDNTSPASTQATVTQSAATKNSDAVLYEHAFVIELRGDYPALRAYVESLAKLPWRFYWDEMDYHVDVYPQAVIKIKVHTVSLAEEWIRV